MKEELSFKYLLIDYN